MHRTWRPGVCLLEIGCHSTPSDTQMISASFCYFFCTICILYCRNICLSNIHISEECYCKDRGLTEVFRTKFPWLFSYGQIEWEVWLLCKCTVLPFIKLAILELGIGWDYCFSRFALSSSLQSFLSHIPLVYMFQIANSSAFPAPITSWEIDICAEMWKQCCWILFWGSSKITADAWLQPWN